ncbi:MAG: lipid-A-disaccharide synthase [Coleofasciculaceae cyanobacterium]
MQAADILILSNGPGEVTTWVRPVVRGLRQKLGDDRSLVRISVVLAPCPNGTGKEEAIAKSYPEVDRVQSAEHFLPFLVQGKTAENWDWREKGVVLFLGGDQFFCVVIGKRLGYRTVVYAEWEARWQRFINQFGVMKPEVITQAGKHYTHKFTVVGDLMADVKSVNVEESKTELIGLLPGSKSAKLLQGVPLTLAIAQHIHKVRPQARFVIPVAPTLDLSTLASFADPHQNPLINQLGWAEAQLVIPTPDSGNKPFLRTASGLCVELWQSFPAHNLLSQCCLCLTTVGANTAELGSLAVPMIVLLPTQQLDAMRAWDGIPGLLARLPGVGQGFSKIINYIIIKQVLNKKRLFAWPNIWAKQQIVPELLGKLDAFVVAQMALNYLENPEKLEDMRQQLKAVRGQPGAAEKLAELVVEELDLLEY